MASNLALLVLGAAIAPVPTLAEFEAVLAAHDSATQALGVWCAARRIADPPAIRAHPDRSERMKPPRSWLREMELTRTEHLALRHVRLSCGKATLSIAWNWYVPERLTGEMNRLLAETDTPFGRVAAPLHFRREPLETFAGAAKPCPAGTISTHRARLRLPDGRPLAMLVECYTSANLGRGN